MNACGQQQNPAFKKQKIGEVFFGEKLFALFHLGLSLILCYTVFRQNFEKRTAA